MKYTKISFGYGKFYLGKTDSLNGYITNHLYTTLGNHLMYVKTEELEIRKEKFKKDF